MGRRRLVMVVMIVVAMVVMVLGPATHHVQAATQVDCRAPVLLVLPPLITCLELLDVNCSVAFFHFFLYLPSLFLFTFLSLFFFLCLLYLSLSLSFSFLSLSVFPSFSIVLSVLLYSLSFVSQSLSSCQQSYPFLSSSLLFIQCYHILSLLFISPEPRVSPPLLFRCIYLS